MEDEPQEWQTLLTWLGPISLSPTREASTATSASQPALRPFPQTCLPTTQTQSKTWPFKYNKAFSEELKQAKPRGTRPKSLFTSRQRNDLRMHRENGTGP